MKPKSEISIELYNLMLKKGLVMTTREEIKQFIAVSYDQVRR